MSEELNEELISRGTAATPHGMAEQVAHGIWGAAVTTTRAFDNVTIKIEPSVNRIFLTIELRWWAKSKKFAPLHRAWLHRAEERCKEQMPEGWKLLIYYKGEK